MADTLRQAVEALRHYNCDCLPADATGGVASDADTEAGRSFYAERQVSDLTAALALPDAGDGSLHQRMTAVVETFELLGKPSREYMIQRIKDELTTPADTPPPLTAEDWKAFADVAQNMHEVVNVFLRDRQNYGTKHGIAEAQSVVDTWMRREAVCRAHAERSRG